MGSHLKLKVTKTPQPNSTLAAKKTKISGRMMRKLFGTTNPKHQIAVLLPGTDNDSVQVQVTKGEDDLMALADAIRRHPSANTRKEGN
ncbi:hypothetical protein ACU21_09180 [Actinobaculum suis]|uniref:hypothetical protein n=1 Tax=Actinomycetes TaxID=1760 RepID=UPI0008086C36|nr:MULTISPECIES: hypothetical protein [Actinomycetes]MCQ9359261.1 hypothetical protein [Corynebacterium sp. 142RC1]MCQ9365402.1 hypothetical protein [Corynebacterium sp. 70RC1]OCA93630.1 hypothetical protein ACU21_09180 [Actinobaculum suis]